MVTKFTPQLTQYRGFINLQEKRNLANSITANNFSYKTYRLLLLIVGSIQPLQSLKRSWIRDNDKLKRNDKEIIGMLPN